MIIIHIMSIVDFRAEIQQAQKAVKVINTERIRNSCTRKFGGFIALAAGLELVSLIPVQGLEELEHVAFAPLGVALANGIGAVFYEYRNRQVRRTLGL